MGEGDDVRRVADVESGRLQVSNECPSGRVSLDTSDVAAAAGWASFAAESGVADAARGALGTAVHRAARDDAAADSVARLDIEQVVAVWPVASVFGQCREVDVVVGQDGRVEITGEPRRNVEAIPARQYGVPDDAAEREVDRCSQPETDAE